MTLRIVYRDGSTEGVEGVHDWDIYSTRLIMRDADGAVIGERDDVATAGQVSKDDGSG